MRVLRECPVPDQPMKAIHRGPDLTSLHVVIFRGGTKLTVGEKTENQRRKKKKTDGWTRTKTEVVTWRAACHGTSCSLSLSVAAVGVTTRAVCVNSRPRLNRLASRRGSLAENSANLPPAASTTLTYTVSLSFFPLYRLLLKTVSREGRGFRKHVIMSSIPNPHIHHSEKKRYLLLQYDAMTLSTILWGYHTPKFSQSANT